MKIVNKIAFIVLFFSVKFQIKTPTIPSVEWSGPTYDLVVATEILTFGNPSTLRCTSGLCGDNRIRTHTIEPSQVFYLLLCVRLPFRHIPVTLKNKKGGNNLNRPLPSTIIKTGTNIITIFKLQNFI